MQSNMQEIELSKIRSHELQPKGRRGISDLVDSIRHVGFVLEPPKIMDNEDGTYILLSGDRRKRATNAIGQKSMVCDVLPMMVMAEQVKILTAANVQQELGPLQKAEILVTLVRSKEMPFTDACSAMGINQVMGRLLLRLADSPDKVRKAMKKGDLSFGTFRRELASLDDDAMLSALAGGTTRRAIKAAKRKMIREQTPERMFDDSSLILTELTTARQAVGKARDWLAGSEAAARAEVLEALRGLRQMLDGAL